MNPIALITGASRGIGQEIAILLAQNHYDLHLICKNNLPLLEDLKQSLQASYGIQCTCYQGNVGDPDFILEVFSNLSHLDVLVNNAGISHVGLLSDMTNDEWNEVMNTNINSYFYTSRAAIPLMLKAKSGHILNISSVFGEYGASMEVAYSASKGAVNSFTKALAKELAPSNIQVNALAPGVIDTSMNAHLSKEEQEELIAQIPADRIGEAKEVALCALRILQMPGYLTGQIITLDGGWM